MKISFVKLSKFKFLCYQNKLNFDIEIFIENEASSKIFIKINLNKLKKNYITCKTHTENNRKNFSSDFESIKANLLNYLKKL